jgi:predicted dehydrogenase
VEWAAGGQAWLETGERRRVLARNPRNAFAQATARTLQLTVDAVSRGEAPPNSVRDARGIVAVVEAAYLSAQTGRRISLAEITGQHERSIHDQR